MKHQGKADGFSYNVREESSGSSRAYRDISSARHRRERGLSVISDVLQSAEVNLAAAGSTATVSARPLAPPDTLKAQAPEELHDDDS